jgi:hypothetical protein
MKHKNSTQNLILKRLLSLCNEHSTSKGFTLDQIASWPPIRARNVKRDSINKALRRFVALGIVLSGRASFKNKPLFRIKNPEWAIAYIEGDKDKPWLPLTPPVPTDEFPDVDKHRPHYPIKLTNEWFDKVKRHGQEKANEFTLRAKEFTISVNGKSLKGTLYIKPYWRTGVQKFFGQEFLDYILSMDSKGMKRGDFCLPLDVKGERFTIGGRPTQFSASHYPAQLDIRASDKDSHIKDGLYALTNQADFNVRVLDMFDALLETLNKQGEVQTRNTEALEKLVKLLSPKPEPEYQAPKDDDKGGLMYG